jgi:hypothetical protein
MNYMNYACFEKKGSVEARNEHLQRIGLGGDTMHGELNLMYKYQFMFSFGLASCTSNIQGLRLPSCLVEPHEE